jgi:serine/threonine protein kinase
MALTSGTKLGPYEIQSQLGAGGMGEVYRALDTRLDRTVAVKVLGSHLSSSVELKQRMEREGRAISSLNHPHICQLYDIGSQNGTDYLVMEFLEGETLAERLRKGALPLAEVFKIAIAVAEALAVAHRHGIVHRDLKPGNIMLTKGGAKLMDFGLAKPAECGLGTRKRAAFVYCGGDDERAEPANSADHGGQHHWHHPVHGSGADRGERSGCSKRHFRIRGCALRDGGGEEAVFGKESDLAGVVNSRGRSGADQRAQAEHAACV